MVQTTERSENTNQNDRFASLPTHRVWVFDFETSHWTQTDIHGSLSDCTEWISNWGRNGKDKTAAIAWPDSSPKPPTEAVQDWSLPWLVSDPDDDDQSRDDRNRSLDHLLALARAGKRPGSSGCEKQARKLVRSILDNAIGLDRSATAGISELVDLIQDDPMDGRDAVRNAIR